MPLIPNPVGRSAFEGFVVEATNISSQFPRPGPPPIRSMASALEPGKDAGDRGGGNTNQMVNALNPKTQQQSYMPARMEILNLARIKSGEDKDLPVGLQVHFNPKELHETIKVIYNEVQIPGLSHARLQYSRTENVMYKFDLHFDALQYEGGKLRGYKGDHGIDIARRFTQSLCYGVDSPKSVADGAPPRVLFYWPNFLSLTCVISEQDWVYNLFAADGTPRRFTCSMGMKEIRDVRLSSSQVLRGNRNTQAPDSNGILKIT